MPKSKTVEHGPSMGEMTTTSSNSLPANRAETGRFVPGSPATRLAGPDVTKILLRSLGCIPKMRLLRWSASRTIRR